MKKLITLAICAALMLSAGNALATIGWAGNVWPNAGTNVVPTGPVDVYLQIWKSGVTDAPGQGADITADMVITNDIGGNMTVAMGYLGDVGSNDEYTAQIPQSMLLGATTVTVDFVVTDLTDASTYSPIQDQGGNTAPLTYNVTDVLPNDVDVTFQLCMSGEVTTGVPCVIGSAAEIGTWGTGVNMTSLGGDLYEVTVTFLAGGNPSFEYKFKKDDCANWESVGNRIVDLPTDGTTSVTLATDSWNNLPIGCGLGQNLSEDKVVCFQVCVADVGTAGGVCTVGGIPELDNWGAGTPAVEIAPGLFQTCIVFPQGMAYPLNVEYKFKKDDCATWESVGNRLIVIEDAMDQTTTVTHNWDDGPGGCDTVAEESASFGTLKSMYR